MRRPLSCQGTSQTPFYIALHPHCTPFVPTHAPALQAYTAAELRMMAEEADGQGGCVGEGGEGKVYVVQGGGMVVKVCSGMSMAEFERQAQVVAAVQGVPFVLETLAFEWEADNSSSSCCSSGEQVGCSYQLMPRVGGTAEPADFDFAIIKRMPEYRLTWYLAAMVVALEQLHARNVVWLDLKCYNILLTEGGAPRCIDFNTAVLSPLDIKFVFAVGSTYYAAPEVRSGKQCGSKIDVWLLGMVAAYGMTRGMHLFGGSPYCAKQARQDALAALPSSTSDDMNDFIECCTLVLKRKERCSAKQLRRHKLFDCIEWSQLERGEFPCW